jgi:serine/threonine protein kinase
MTDTQYRPTIALGPLGNPSEAAIAAAQNLDALRPGAHLDEFEIVRVLGAGGFGIVYLALDQVLLRYVAIKEYLPTALAARGENQVVSVRSTVQAQTFALGLDSFFNEARMLASFDHPSLVKVHRFWKANGTAYMAMQYYPGQTLRDVRSTLTAPPDETWLRAFIDPLLGALEVLHKQAVYHRDIAPDNILLLPDGRPVLLDFGSARRVIGDLTQSLTAVLKPNFSPIEQYADEVHMRQGDWTDLYSLGATTHFMLTGKTPTPAVMRVVRDVLPALSHMHNDFPGVSAQFLAAIDWSLALPVQERPQSVAELRKALDGEFAPPAPTVRHQQISRAASPENDDNAVDARPLDKALTRIEPRAADDFAHTVLTQPTVAAAMPVTGESPPSPMAATRRRAAIVALVTLVLCLSSVGWVALRHSVTAPSANPVPTNLAIAEPGVSVGAKLTGVPGSSGSGPDPGTGPLAYEQVGSEHYIKSASSNVREPVKMEPTGRLYPRRRAVAEESERVAASVPGTTEQPLRSAHVAVVGTGTPLSVARRPDEVCASLNFFARSICLRRQCRSPQWRMDPQCTETRTVEDAQQQRGQL